MDDLPDRADHPVLGGVTVDHRERVQAVLRAERARHIVMAERDAAHSEISVAESDQVVEVHGEVSTREGTEPEVDDPRTDGAAVEARPNRISAGEGGVSEGAVRHE